MGEGGEIKRQSLAVWGQHLSRCLSVSGCLPKDLSLSLARPRAPLPCAKSPCHRPDDLLCPTPHASLGDRRRCRPGSPAQTPRGGCYPFSGGATRFWISLSRVTKFLGTLQNVGGCEGPRSGLGKRDALEVLSRGKTPSPPTIPCVLGLP